MKYKISHRTHYQYDTPASLSHSELVLIPRNSEFQTCNQSRVCLKPKPSVRSIRQDYFGNTVINICLESPHSELDILAEAEVTLHPAAQLMPDQTPLWEQVKEKMMVYETPRDLEAFEFIFPSPMVQPNKEIARWAAEVFTPGTPILRAALDLSHRIFTEFAYDPNATNTSTPLAKAFEIKRGVCQDFAHVGIACLRAMGLAARYVSGYLNTQPPPGKSKLVGADASHAWFSIYIPGLGWVDMDPTNDVVPNDQHITLAWGRDYGDITPVRGSVLGGGNHRLQVAVDVMQQPLS